VTTWNEPAELGGAPDPTAAAAEPFDSTALARGTVPAPGAAGMRARGPWRATALRWLSGLLTTDHLIRQVDARIILILCLLIGADSILIAVHLVLRILVKLSYHDVEVFDDMWYINQEFSYSEILGYAKMTVIVAALIEIQLVSNQWLYVGWIALFGTAVLDDAFAIHEHLGHVLMGVSAAVLPADLQEQICELAIWAAIGFPLLALAVAGVRLAWPAPEDRSNTLLLLLAFAIFAGFSVGVDTIHMALGEFVYGAGLLLSTMEDGGEEILLSLICVLVLLIGRSKNRGLGPARPSTISPC
jgi:hypothetical protein